MTSTFLKCPSWCRSPHDEVGPLDPGPSRVHASEDVAWSDSPEHTAWIDSFEGNGNTPAEEPSIYVTDVEFGDEGVTVTTPGDARRLAAVLLQLADELEKG